MTTALSFKQQSIVIGSLLGDGHLSNPKWGNSAFTKCQTGKRRKYIDWTYTELNPFSSSVTEYDNKCEGKKYRKAVYLSKALPIFTDLRHKWYPVGKKKIPKDLKLDPLSIAIWYFDDGSNSIKARQCSFATYCFAKEDCDYLCRQLSEFGIDAYVNKSCVIKTRSNTYRQMIDLVKPYMIWPFFEHKIRYRDSELDFTTDEQAKEMFRLHEMGVTYQKISAETGKSVSVISSILRGDRMKHLGLAKSNGGLSLKNTSGHKGVAWDKSRNKWVVSFKRNGKNLTLGRFDEKKKAVETANNFLKNTCLEFDNHLLKGIHETI